jgi:hypothetical protein
MTPEEARQKLISMGIHVPAAPSVGDLTSVYIKATRSLKQMYDMVRDVIRDEYDKVAVMKFRFRAEPYISKEKELWERLRKIDKGYHDSVKEIEAIMVTLDPGWEPPILDLSA